MKQFFLMLSMGLVIMSCHKKDSDAPSFLNFNVTTLSLPPVPGASADLIVESNIDWQVSVAAGTDWLQLSKTSGHGNDTIHVSVIKDNQNAAARSAAVTAVPVNSGINLQAQATIEQKPYNVQLFSQKTFGGSDRDYIFDIVPTQDGGLFLTGVTSSNKNGDVGTNHGDYDAWMVKLNSNHDTVWTRVMGGTMYDGAWKAVATADGGFAIAAYTQSKNTGDVGANHGNTDWWIIKLKSNGDTAWTKLVGGVYNDYANSIAATPDGGFVVVGDTYTSSSSMDEDVMVVKFNSDGDIAWQKTYGGSSMDDASAVTVYPNGTMMIAATTTSNNNGDVGATHGNWDYWIIKLNANGDKAWGKAYGGNLYDTPFALANTADGGAIITGSSFSSQNGDVTGANHGDEDVWVVKVNANGDMEWNTLLGGTRSDVASAVKVTPDGGYLIAGDSDSKDGDVGPTQGSYDLWVLKLNTSGKILWSKTFGGTGIDEESALLLNTDGSFYVTGDTESSGHGQADGWLLKLKDY
jgi:hypothetical protein